ncbi:MAG: Uncharacterized MFS-type transporter, partial [uncultured Rubrobacteraceae bacterium]
DAPEDAGPPARAACGARRLFYQRLRARGLVRPDTRCPGQAGGRGGAARGGAARGGGRGATVDDGDGRPDLAPRQPPGGRDDGGPACRLPRAAGTRPERAPPRAGPRARRGGQRGAGRLDERPRRGGRGAVRATHHVLLPRLFQLRGAGRLRARRRGRLPGRRGTPPLSRGLRPGDARHRPGLPGAPALGRGRGGRREAGVRPPDAGALRARRHLFLRLARGGRDVGLERCLPGQRPQDRPRLRRRGLRGLLPRDGPRPPLWRRPDREVRPNPPGPPLRRRSRPRARLRLGRRRPRLRPRRLRLRRRGLLSGLPPRPERRRPDGGRRHRSGARRRLDRRLHGLPRRPAHHRLSRRARRARRRPLPRRWPEHRGLSSRRHRQERQGEV